MLISDIALYLRMPPGPRPLPFIGNKLDIPKKHPWVQFAKWGAEFGPIFVLYIGRRPTIIVSDPEVAVDLLEKRSNKYSSRPRMVAMAEIYNDMASILVQPYSKDWLIRRKLLHSALTNKALQLYKPVQVAESCRLCYQLLANPESYEGLLDRLTSSIVFSVSYGHRIDDYQSPIIRQRLGFMQYMASLNIPGAYLVETIPALKYVPNFFAPWKSEIERRGNMESRANMRLVDIVKQDIADAKTPDDVPSSLTKQMLDARTADPASFALLSDRDFSYIPASLFGAGSDTTSSTLCSAFLALITHPGTLRAAHAELDAVIGAERMPNFEDEVSLPYIRALCKETLRWRPVAVLGGTPHASTAPDTYRGYYIPTGTTVLGNTWAINLNPEYYPNPHHYNPLRFLDVNPESLDYLPRDYLASTPTEKGKPHPSNLGHSSFGWGRRICPGAGLASNTLFIALAQLLWGFDILPVKGAVYDTFDYTDGFNIRPRPFKCQIEVRSTQHRRVLEKDNESAEEYVARFPPFTEEIKL